MIFHRENIKHINKTERLFNQENSIPQFETGPGCNNHNGPKNFDCWYGPKTA